MLARTRNHGCSDRIMGDSFVHKIRMVCCLLFLLPFFGHQCCGLSEMKIDTSFDLIHKKEKTISGEQLKLSIARRRGDNSASASNKVPYLKNRGYDFSRGAKILRGGNDDLEVFSKSPFTIFAANIARIQRTVQRMFFLLSPLYFFALTVRLRRDRTLRPSLFRRPILARQHQHMVCSAPTLLEQICAINIRRTWPDNVFLFSDIWNHEGKIVYSLNRCKLFFVDRDDVIHQLQAVHNQNFYRALEMGVGDDWKIPISDNLLGTGKSELGRHYIEHCRIEWSDATSRTEVQEVLCNCHTVHISIPESAFAEGPVSFQAVMLQLLVEALGPRFKTKPKCLDISYRRTADFLRDLTAVVGPIFIILDEIGRAFAINGLNLKQQQEWFLKFCELVLGGWMELTSVFFLLLGRGAFLNNVGRRPGYQDDGPQLFDSPFVFERLGIRLLRKEAIEEILKKTYVDNFQQKTLVEYYALHVNEIKAAVEHLFAQTSGHPRSLVNALRNCQTKQELISFAQPLRIERMRALCDDLIRNSDVITKLLEKMRNHEPVNLLSMIRKGKRSVCLEIICNSALIGWAGTKNEAVLFAPPSVVEFLIGLYMPFRKFLGVITSSLELGTPLNFPNVFELMLVKRFQEIFSSKRCPREVLPAFFSTPLFGRLENLVLPSKMHLLPKITERGERNPTLNSLTAHPSSWRFLMKEIDDSGPKCYRPRSKSASSDAIFRVYRSSMHITVGVAAKNYDVETPFGYPCLARECSVYNKMFFRAPRAQRSNILIICATNYIAAMKSQFEGKNFMIFTDARYKHIDEIIVLDLSSKQNLADFFGLNDDNHTLETIQDVLKKVVTLQSDDDDEASDILKS